MTKNSPHEIESSKLRTVASATRKALYEKYGGVCAFCGESNVPLEIAHIIPFQDGGTNELDNLILLCPNCHRRMDYSNPREVDFINYLTELLELNPFFQIVKSEHTTYEVGADILAARKTQAGLEQIAVECKNYSAFSSQRLIAILDQVKADQRHNKNKIYILAFLGRISEQHHSLLTAENVELWDIDYIANNFSEQIEQVEHPYFQPLFQAISSRRKDDKNKSLIAELKSCEPGRANWVVFQKLVTKILEDLFCPPLNSPITELSDLTGANRRDIIMPNYASDGFWRFLRDTYHADYVVIDAKNYKGAVKKKEALQIANYLKSHGAGLFGLIICRTNGDSGCMHTIREQWMAYRKMILILNDEDIEAMLLAKSSKGNPEDIISQRIEQFRLSM